MGRLSVLLLCSLALVPAFGQLGTFASQNSGGWAVHGSGGDAGYGSTWQVNDMLMSRAKPQPLLTYRFVGPDRGHAELLASYASAQADRSASFAHFTIGNKPLNATAYAQMGAAGGVLHVPLLLSKIAVLHNVAGSATNLANATTTSAGMSLSACTLAKIFLRQITTWGHPEITAQNQALAAAGGIPSNMPITVWRYTDEPGWTWSLSTYLSKACPSVWTYGSTFDLGNLWSADIRATSDIFQLMTGLQGAAGSITYMDSMAAGYFGLTEVAITNLYGAQLTSQQADSAQLATALQVGQYPGIEADWNGLQFVNVPGPSSWPMTKINFLIIPRNSSYLGAAGSLLQALGEFYLQQDVQDTLTQRKYTVGLTQAVRDDLIAQLRSKLVLDPSAPRWSFEGRNPILTIAGQQDYVISARRESYSVLQAQRLDRRVQTLEALVQGILQNETLAAQVRAQLYDITQVNAFNAGRIQKAQQIAVAGVVLAVLLAFIALVIAAVWVTKTKKLDQKYSKYIPLGAQGRWKDGGDGL